MATNTSSVNVTSVEDLVDLEAPFHEVGILACAVSFLYLLPLLLRVEMPVYKDFADEMAAERKGHSDFAAFPATPWSALTLIVATVYYLVICSNERVFQSMQFTFGLCGPLQLEPKDAVFIDKMYNGGFMVGR